MTTTVKAVYENGVLRPSERLPFEEGATVEVTVVTPRAEPAPHDPQAVARFLAEIAALADPSKEPQDGLSGSRDHDKILYGGPKGAL